MEVDREEAMKRAKEKAKRDAELMWPENEPEKREAAEKELTWRFFKDYTTP